MITYTNTNSSDIHALYYNALLIPAELDVSYASVHTFLKVIVTI